MELLTPFSNTIVYMNSIDCNEYLPKYTALVQDLERRLGYSIGESLERSDSSEVLVDKTSRPLADRLKELPESWW